jgi:hypothetical protein
MIDTRVSTLTFHEQEINNLINTYQVLAIVKNKKIIFKLQQFCHIYIKQIGDSIYYHVTRMHNFVNHL